MADNFCQFSSQLKFKSKKAADALELLIKSPETLDPEYYDYGSPCAWERENDTTLWLYSMDYFDDHFFTTLLTAWAKRFPEEWGTISYAYSCSKPRVDEFGGNVIAFAGGKVKFFSPLDPASEWVRKKRIVEEETTE